MRSNKEDTMPECDKKDELTHWGVLGMKWGVRRSEAQLARARNSSNQESPNLDSIKSKAKIITDGIVGVLGAKAVFSVASGVAKMTGKNYTANTLSRMGNMAMVGGGIVTTVNLLTNKGRSDSNAE